MDNGEIHFTRDDADRLIRVEEAIKVLPDIKDWLIKQNDRMNKVEKKISYFSGGIAVFFAVITWIVTAHR